MLWFGRYVFESLPVSIENKYLPLWWRALIGETAKKHELELRKWSNVVDSFPFSPGCLLHFTLQPYLSMSDLFLHEDAAPSLKILLWGWISWHSKIVENNQRGNFFNFSENFYEKISFWMIKGDLSNHPSPWNQLCVAPFWLEVLMSYKAH